MRIGFGFDVHQLVEGRAFILGGVEIESKKGEKYTVNSEHILCLKTSGMNYIMKRKNKFKVQYFKKDTYNYHTKIFTEKKDAENYLDELINGLFFYYK
jgi:hypothetical protein